MLSWLFKRWPKLTLPPPRESLTEDQAKQVIGGYLRRQKFINGYAGVLPDDMLEAWTVGSYNRMAEKVRAYTEDYEHLDQEDTGPQSKP